MTKKAKVEKKKAEPTPPKIKTRADTTPKPTPKAPAKAKVAARPRSREDIKIDIARAREENYYPKGSLPSVSISNIKKDIQRREFTIWMRLLLEREQCFVVIRI